MICFYCNTEKTEDLFYRITGKKFQCKACHSLYISNYLKSRPDKTLKNREYAQISTPTLRQTNRLNSWKLKQRPCMDCNQKFHPMVMEFDHRPGTIKIAPVSVLVWKKRSKQIIDEEIAKCDLVCANCHRIRTIKRQFGQELFDKWSKY